MTTSAPLKEGWNCPSAYVLCATQRLQSRGAVEQLLGRVPRMPNAAGRKDAALIAHTPGSQSHRSGRPPKSWPTGVLIWDSRTRRSGTPCSLVAWGRTFRGELFDHDPVRPNPILQFTMPDSEDARERLSRWQDGSSVKHGRRSKTAI